jgi:transposase
VKIEVSELPNDVEALKKLIQELDRSYSNQIEALQEQLRLFRDKLYGRKSERTSEEELTQLRLFNEAEAGLMPSVSPPSSPIRVRAHTRRKRGRRRLPADIPRLEIVHDIPEENKRCACGAALSKIGEEVSEKLDVIPPQVRVIRHVRPKYACRGCQGVDTEGGAVKIAPAAPQILEKSIATEGTLAWILTGKFEDALPFYRQEKMFRRLRVELSRATMCNWALEAARKLQPIEELLIRELKSGPLIQIDETPVQVLDEPRRSASTKSYMWVYRGGQPGKPVVIFRYDPSRSGSIPMEFLQGYRGTVQTDGYTGYNELGRQPGIVHAGCWAHARRKYIEVTKVSTKPGKAEEALRFIGDLYKVESKAQGLSVEEKQALRQREARPVLGSFHPWLIQLQDQTPPEGLLGKAVQYTLGQWDRLVRYLDNGLLSPDNNLAENAIRPFVIGRRNWLFSATARGAWASALLYGMIETAKANKLVPYWYLRHAFTRLPCAHSTADHAELLPHRLNMDDLLKSVGTTP